MPTIITWKYDGGEAASDDELRDPEVQRAHAGDAVVHDAMGAGNLDRIEGAYLYVEFGEGAETTKRALRAARRTPRAALERKAMPRAYTMSPWQCIESSCTSFLGVNVIRKSCSLEVFPQLSEVLPQPVVTPR